MNLYRDCIDNIKKKNISELTCVVAVTICYDVHRQQSLRPNTMAVIRMD